jgi:hypothetical protein
MKNRKQNETSFGLKVEKKFNVTQENILITSFTTILGM